MKPIVRWMARSFHCLHLIALGLRPQARLSCSLDALLAQPRSQAMEGVLPQRHCQWHRGKLSQQVERVLCKPSQRMEGVMLHCRGARHWDELRQNRLYQFTKV